jgi:hypothetical protein
MRQAIGSALVVIGVALWMSVPVMLAWRGRVLTWPEWLLFMALPLVLGGVLLAS